MYMIAVNIFSNQIAFAMTILILSSGNPTCCWLNMQQVAIGGWLFTVTERRIFFHTMIQPLRKMSISYFKLEYVGPSEHGD